VIRLLLVDDEPLVMRGIERALRSRRPSWKLLVATGGDEALAIIERNDLDVIASDIGMPGMDGVTLLHQVRERRPHIARLALSGEARFTDRMRGVLEIHQWLAKPCSTAKLIETIERVQWGRALVEDHAIVSSLTGLASLPSTLPFYRSVARAIERDASYEELITLAESDVGISTKLLQLVNSAFFTDGQRVVTARLAGKILGVDRLRSLLVASESKFSPDAATIGKRARFVAQLARSFAPAHADDAFLAGFVHDVARLALATLGGDPLSARDAARSSGLLLATWGIPAEVVQAVAHHIDPRAAPDPKEPRLCALALAVALVEEIEGTTRDATAIATLAAALGLDPDECRRRAHATKPADHDPGISSTIPSPILSPRSTR
jgi:CheY-like chemotaxis protein